MLMSPLALILLLSPQEGRPVDMGPLLGELRGLRQQMALLELAARQRDAVLDEMRTQLRTLSSDLSDAKERSAPAPAGPFIDGPPMPSDAVGIAKVVVFGPRLEGDNVRRRDLVKVRVRRVESAGYRTVGEVELGADGFVDLPVDQNGALYVADWSTGDGQTFALILRDGATHQEAAAAKVKPLQAEGLFFFVGYRLP